MKALTPRTFAIVPAALAFDARLGKLAFRVGVLMASYANKDRECWLAVDTVASLLKVDRRAVQRARAQLVACGHAAVKPRTAPGRGKISSVYVILFDRVPTAEPSPNLSSEAENQSASLAVNSTVPAPNGDPPRSNPPPLPSRGGQNVLAGAVISDPDERSNPPPNQYAISMREQDDEEDARAREASSSTIPAVVGDDQAVEIFNETARRIGWIETQHLTRKVREQLVARIAECDGIQGWRDAMALVEQSTFLRTKLQPACRHLGWLVDQDHFTSLMHGRYNPENDPLTPAQVGIAMAFAWRAKLTEETQYVGDPEPEPAPLQPKPDRLSIELGHIARATCMPRDEVRSAVLKLHRELVSAGFEVDAARSILTDEARRIPKTSYALKGLQERVAHQVKNGPRPQP